MENLTTEELVLIEGIKLIAEFDGYKIGADFQKPSEWLEKYVADSLRSYQYKNLDGNIADGLLKLGYHNSWNLIMNIVDKIENIEINEFKPFAVDIECSECTIKDYGVLGDSIVSYAENDNKKLAVFYAIVDFLNWYNKRKN